VRNPVPRSISPKCNWTPGSLALLFVLALSGCTTFKPPQISYDDEVPPSPDLPMPADDHARPLHVPPSWTPARGGKKGDQEAKEPAERITTANDAARVEPRRAGYFNAVQVFPYSPGALYQVYASPGQITDIALEPGEQLTGSGPLAAGDTVRWIVGDTESGNGDTRRVHIMVKPTRPAIETNLVVNTDRRTYLIELRSREKPYMPSVAWSTRKSDPAVQGLCHQLQSFRKWISAATVMSSKATARRGDRSMPMMMAARSISSSRPALPKEKCRRCSSSARMASPNSSTIAPTRMS
jgi:type IV secretion system protein TrbG